MPANFWELQRRAKKKTGLYLAAFVIITLVVATCLEICFRYLVNDAYSSQGQFPFLGLLFLGITFSVAAFQYITFAFKGGSYVAASVGGRKVEVNATDFKERMLLNIVDEMAIASSVKKPSVYILDSSQINAFAAGISDEDAAIAVTKGALDRLSREELQGVIAHEFGHIYNGDMKISLRLAAMIMGFFFVLYLALRLLQIASFRRGSRNGRGQNPLLLAALLLMGAGAITWFAGSLLKAMVSRQREYLADACAVQFTRNPEGIANALHKIAKESRSDMPKEGMAFSHMYLDNHLGWNSLFATHPPLEKRIKAILGLQYLPPEWRKELT